VAEVLSIPRQRWMRIIPIAFVMYTLAFVDRINIGFAIPGLQKDLGISATGAGLAGGVFFLGYLFLQMPGGHWATVWSARKLVTILLVCWGSLAVLSGLVHNALELCLVRFLLGLAEGGVWPATLILLTRWFPREERGRANSYWLFCIPMASVVMAPVSGWILTWADWRALLVLEGLPPLLWAFVWWFMIADTPEQARWLSQSEKDYLARKFAEEQTDMDALPTRRGSWRDTILNPRVWQLVLAHFLGVFGIYGTNLWLPVMIKSMTGVNVELIGLLATLPFLAAMVGLYFNAGHADRTGECKKHIAIPHLIGASALAVSAWVGSVSPWVGMVSLIIAEGCLLSSLGIFWALPTRFLPREVLGSGVGFINALGNLGGFIGPLVVGYCFSATHTSLVGMLIMSSSLILGAVTILLFHEPPARKLVEMKVAGEQDREERGLILSSGGCSPIWKEDHHSSGD
jgi:sugar phosphate permease